MPSDNRGNSTVSAKPAQTKPSAVAKSPTIRRMPTQQQLNRRQARAAQRAAERRRRTAIVSGVFATLVVAAIVALLWNHLPWNSTTSTGSASTADKSACAPTPTVVGPAPAVEVPATPPPTPAGTAVKTADQGLQYVDIKVGCGNAVQAGDNVTVNYSGWVASTGKLFDSSLKPGRTPFQLQNVGQAQVIEGWNIGLQGMKPGGTRRLIIPSALAYGSAGAPQGGIPGNATLIFDVTLISIDQ